MPQLTNSAIISILKEKSTGSNSELVRFLPVFDVDESEQRELFLIRHLADWFYGKDQSKPEKYRPTIGARFAAYVKGAELDREILKPLSRDVWEFKIQFSRHSPFNTRIFGTFAHPDKLICYRYKMRSSLDDKSDLRWDQAFDEVLKDWTSMFPGFTPITFDPPSNCVTQKYIDDEDLGDW